MHSQQPAASQPAASQPAASQQPASSQPVQPAHRLPPRARPHTRRTRAHTGQVLGRSTSSFGSGHLIKRPFLKVFHHSITQRAPAGWRPGKRPTGAEAISAYHIRQLPHTVRAPHTHTADRARPRHKVARLATATGAGRRCLSVTHAAQAREHRRRRSRSRAAHTALAAPARSLRLVTLRAEVRDGVPALRVLSTRHTDSGAGR